MEQSPSWEANRLSASQEISRVLWNPKVYYLIQTPTTRPYLRQIDPIHIPTAHFLNIHLNIILPSTPGSSKWSISLRFPHQNPAYVSPPYMLHACPSYSSRFNHPKKKGEVYRSFGSSLCNFLHFPVASSLLGPNILLKSFSQTPSVLAIT
jgi:hypothetical protein